MASCIFACTDIAPCMGYCATNFPHQKIKSKMGVIKMKNSYRDTWLNAISESAIRTITNKRYRGRDFTDFLLWFDQICEENRPAPTPEPKKEVLNTVPTIPDEVNKEKLKAFFDGAAEFFTLCSKLIA